MADSKVSSRPSATSLVASDLFLVITDANGTPVSKKINLKTLLSQLNSNTTITAAVSTITANTTINGTVDINTSANASFDLKVRSSGDASLLFTDAGNNCIGVGTSLPQAKLDINSDKFRLRTAVTPASSNASTVGVKTGTVMWDTNYIYITTDSNTIKRAALSTF